MGLAATLSHSVLSRLLIIVVFVTTTGRAAETAHESYEARLARLEAEYAQLASQVTRLPAASCTAACRTCCGPAPGIVGGAAVVFAQPYLSGNVPFDQSFFVNGAFVESAPSFDFDFEATPRVWFGYQTSNGHGIRARYWTFDGDSQLISLTDPANGPPDTVVRILGLVGSDLTVTSTSAANTFFIADQNLEMDVVDLEYTRRLARSWGDFYFSGGVRYVHYEQVTSITTNFQNSFMSSRFDLEGLGPSLGVELIVPTLSTIELFGSGRAAILLSDFDQRIESSDLGLLLAVLTAQDRNHAVGAFEAELGIRAARQLGSGATLFAQGSVESQLWTELAHSRHDLANLGFFGLGAAMGVRR